MEKSKYLSRGTNIGGHYEIIDVLGDDDFEILYLVRDTHRKGSFFVLKELFLETFSSRKNKLVVTVAEAKGLFEKQRKEIISEVNFLKTKNYHDEVKIYGYIEDNNTIYTIMEFNNNFHLESYLDFEPKDEIVLPPLDLPEIKENKKSSFLFLKILMVSVAVGAVLVFYASKMINEDREKAKEKPPAVIVNQTSIHHPKLVVRETKSQEEVETKNEFPKKPLKTAPEGAEYLPFEESVKEEVEVAKVIKEPESPKPFMDENRVYVDNEVEEIPVSQEEKQLPTAPLPSSTPIIKETPIVKSSNLQELPHNISLGTKIESKKEHPISLGRPLGKSTQDVFSRESIKHFLDKFIASSATGSVDDIASQYDYHVDRYFSLRNVTRTTIKHDKIRYNRKWTHRNFNIKYFKIIRHYLKDGTDYCTLKTTTRWSVSTDNGKRASGISRGFMTIKNTPNGFKVKSIYTLK